VKSAVNQPLPRSRLVSIIGSRSFLCLVGLGCLGFVTLVTLAFKAPRGGAAVDQPASAKPAADAVGQQPQATKDTPSDKRPVILLTGFEPFGERRSPNPSWEAIKDLDGQHWKGYQLVCKQARVVWGAPLEQLQGWIAEYRPVAVFSFGQGAKGSFALETRAGNQRGDKRDNLDKQPPTPTIVTDGPAQFRASMNHEEISRLLAEKGYLVHVSVNAGRYLCEEALYSLEYLKSTQRLEATVSFCHVPPLNSELGGTVVTAGYVQQFVKDMLEAWYTIYPRRQEVKDFIGRYFRTWSEQDMKGYNECFLPDACIQYIDSNGGLSTQSRVHFIASQTDYHRRARDRAVEVPESIEVSFEAKLARAVVYWKLTAGARIERGYDHFTLLKHEGNWRIVNLVFYPADQKITP
jgi:pyroglutamyl-peptidase